MPSPQVPELPARLDLLQRELADRLQHPESRLPLLLALAQQALVDQRPEPVQHVDAQAAPDGADRLGRLQGTAAHEHRQPTEQSLLRPIQQVVAPGDRVAQGLLPTGPVRRASRQQGEPAPQARASIAGGESRRMCTAASSMASGRPSRREQISATAGALSSVT